MSETIRRREREIEGRCPECGEFLGDEGCVTVGCSGGERNPRERGDDDGVEYADPRDELEDRLFRD